MSAVETEPEALCATCGDRRARWGDECMACARYRRRTGIRRSGALIATHSQRRAAAVGQAGASVFTKVRSTLSSDGGLRPIFGPAEIICVACGTVRALPRGATFILCPRHVGVLALAAAVLDDDHDLAWIMEAITA